jgi:outer membrane receptor protein involved in Fe transport
MLLSLAVIARAEPGAPDPEPPLSDLLDLFDDHIDDPTSVADGAPRSQREASALVTVLTGDEIERLGARDLMDALKLIPGIDFAADVFNSALFFVRGTWSDGRVLLLIDGHDVTEAVYGTATFGVRIPVGAIERIEVVRGPGSAVYGGYAMLAVVKVTTRSGSIDGGRVDGQASWLPSGAYGRQTLTGSAGGPIGDDGHVGVTASIGRGRRSDATYTDVFGGTFDLTDASALDPALLSVQLHDDRWDVAVAGEREETTWRDGPQHAFPRDHDNDYTGLYGRAQYTAPIASSAALRAYWSSSWQEPWRSTRGFPEDSYSYFLTRVDRHTLGTELVLPKPRWELRTGVEGGLDRAFGYYDFDDPVYQRMAAWGQVSVHGPVNLTGGVRFDASNAFGAAASPRLVVGRSWRRAHFKLAANRAFRAPGIAQAPYGVSAETLSALEAEVGVGPTAWSYLTVSAYRNWLDDLMTYEFDPGDGGSEGYVNNHGFETEGIETDLQVLTGPLDGHVGWTVLHSPGEAPDTYAVPGHDGRLLGVPSHRGVIRLSTDIDDRVVLGAVGTVLGPRWTIPAVVGEEPRYERLPAAFVLDASVAVRHALIRGVTVGVTGHDLLNQNPPLLTPYDDWQPPLPQSGREILLQLTVDR